MTHIEWTSELDVNVAAMNDQHKILINYMNQLSDKVEAGETGEKLKPLLDKLVNFAIKHFQDEEAYMEKIAYDGLARHKLQHQRLLANMQTFLDEFNQKGQLTDEFFRFLKVWLMSHIKGVDKKYGEAS